MEHMLTNDIFWAASQIYETWIKYIYLDITFQFSLCFCKLLMLWNHSTVILNWWFCCKGLLEGYAHCPSGRTLILGIIDPVHLPRQPNIGVKAISLEVATRSDQEFGLKNRQFKVTAL